MYKGNFNVQLSHAPHMKCILPSASETLVMPKTRSQDIQRLEALQAARPLKPPTDKRPPIIDRRF